jgi:molybdenum cofactor biosynthesis enzyme MoaA
MGYCTVHNSTDDATFAAQKKIKGLCILFVFILSMDCLFCYYIKWLLLTVDRQNKFCVYKNIFF